MKKRYTLLGLMIAAIVMCLCSLQVSTTEKSDSINSGYDIANVSHETFPDAAISAWPIYIKKCLLPEFRTATDQYNFYAIVQRDVGLRRMQIYDNRYLRRSHVQEKINDTGQDRSWRRVEIVKLC